MNKFLLGLVSFSLAGCCVVGENNVETAPYTKITDSQETQIEVREYPDMILASTSMRGGDRDGAFKRLFGYISGENVNAEDIDMTAPVIMDDAKSVEIAMTAPVFMDAEKQAEPMMSFVLPEDFTAETAPIPTNSNVMVHKVTDYTVAAITFSGKLSDDNINEHRDILEQWIVDNNYVVVGPVKTAGYDAPFTLPNLRRNEVLIPVEKKS